MCKSVGLGFRVEAIVLKGEIVDILIDWLIVLQICLWKISVSVSAWVEQLYHQRDGEVPTLVGLLQWCCMHAFGGFPSMHFHACKQASEKQNFVSAIIFHCNWPSNPLLKTQLKSSQCANFSYGRSLNQCTLVLCWRTRSNSGTSFPIRVAFFFSSRYLGFWALLSMQHRIEHVELIVFFHLDTSFLRCLSCSINSSM